MALLICTRVLSANNASVTNVTLPIRPRQMLITSNVLDLDACENITLSGLEA